VVEGEELPIFGDGSQLRDFTYVDDAVDAFLLAGARAEAHGEIFNVGGGSPISLLELAELLIQLAGDGSYRLVPFPEARRSIDIGDYFADDTKIRRQLGWEQSVPLSEGLVRSLAYYRANAADYW
jgi:UDP-glucose 4-epimerase